MAYIVSLRIEICFFFPSIKQKEKNDKIQIIKKYK